MDFLALRAAGARRTTAPSEDASVPDAATAAISSIAEIAWKRNGQPLLFLPGQRMFHKVPDGWPSREAKYLPQVCHSGATWPRDSARVTPEMANRARGYSSTNLDPER